jgi:hypothetical protein
LRPMSERPTRIIALRIRQGHQFGAQFLRFRERFSQERTVPETAQDGKAVRSIGHLVAQVARAAVDDFDVGGHVAACRDRRNAERDEQLELLLISLRSLRLRPSAVAPVCL